MLHRHMTRERYELAQEADPKLAERMRVKALACPRCQAALDEPPLGSALAAWAVPAEITKPIDWRSALRTAIAPAAQPVAPPRRARWRMPGLALVVYGHSHREMIDTVVNGVRLMQPRNYAATVGLATLNLTRQNVRLAHPAILGGMQQLVVRCAAPQEVGKAASEFEIRDGMRRRGIGRVRIALDAE